jgi:murein DD-endopeptidase MepM/ murein hydrolase activator NlpD
VVLRQPALSRSVLGPRIILSSGLLELDRRMNNPVPPYVITCPYGTPGDWAAGYHTGDDYSTHGLLGVPVYATQRGRVVSVSGLWGSAYGNCVVTVGPLGLIQVGYAHLSAVSVRAGDRVTRGQLVGHSGNSGRVTGPHLHYEERRWPWRYSNNRRPRFNDQRS